MRFKPNQQITYKQNSSKYALSWDASNLEEGEGRGSISKVIQICTADKKMMEQHKQKNIKSSL